MVRKKLISNRNALLSFIVKYVQSPLLIVNVGVNVSTSRSLKVTVKRNWFGGIFSLITSLLTVGRLMKDGLYR